MLYPERIVYPRLRKVKKKIKDAKGLRFWSMSVILFSFDDWSL